MSDAIVRLRVESQEYDAKLKRAAEGLQRYAEKCRELGGTLEVVESDTLEYISAIGKMQTVNKSAQGSIEEMTHAYQELARIYKQMTDAEKASPTGKVLSQSLSELKTRIIDSKQELADINKELGITTKTSGDTSISIKDLAGAFGLNTKSLTTMGAALGLTNGAFEVAKDTININREATDELNRSVESLSSVYDSFLISINNGDITGFLTRINEIVGAAREAYNAMSDLAEFNAFNRVNVQKARTGLTETVADYREGNATEAQVRQANENLKQQLRERAAKEQAVYEENIRKIASQYGVNTESLQQLLASPYQEWHNTKHALKIGSGVKWTPMPFGTAAGAATGMMQSVMPRHYAVTDQEKLSELARRIPLDSLDKLQQMGQQAEATNTEIANLDKRLARMLSRKTTTTITPTGGGTNEPTYAPDSIAAQQALVQSLTSQWRDAGADVRDGYLAQLIEAEKVLKQMNDEQTNLRDKMLGKFQGGFVQTSMRDLAPNGIVNTSDSLRIGWGLSWQTRQKFNEKNQPKEQKEKKEDKTVMSEVSKITSGVSGIFSGIEQMGIELPEELKGIMNGIQGVMTILTSINTILGVIEGMQTVGLIPFFARGGMVPHAASGTLIPGNSFSGDNVFAGHAWVNSGELVLNRAQQNTLAGMLDNNRQPSGSGNGVARVSGEQIYIAVNNYLRRSGKGELVTWR